jgi:DNA-binding beta-propeller fold protein YncE
MNSLCTTGSGMSGLTSSVISGLPAPTGLTVNNSIAIPLDSDPDLILHYSFNGDILNYGSSTSLNTNLGPTIGVSDAAFVPSSGSSVSLNSGLSIFKNGTSLYQSSFNSTNYLSINNIPANTGGYTFSFWLYLSNTQRGVIFAFADALNNRICLYQPNATQWTMFFYGYTQATFITITSYLNTWTHFTLTFSKSNQFILYVNGVSTYSNTATYNASSFVNNRILGDTSGAEGKIVNMNDFRYYNRVLNIYEIKQLYNIYFDNISNPTYSTPSSNFYLNTDISLALYYPFNNNLNNFKTGTAGTLTGTTALNYSNVKVGTGSLYNSTASTTNYFTPAAITNTRTGWTFSCWIYLSSTPTSSVINTSAIWYFGLNTNGSTGGHLYLTIKNNLQIFMNQGVSNGTPNPIYNPIATYYVSTITTTQWYHVVITADIANNTTYYINSVNVGNTPGTANPYLNSYGISNAVGALSRNSLFGINAIATSGYTYPPLNYPGIPGYIDDFRVYNRELTQSEITLLYSYNNYPMSTLNLNTDPSLCLYYTFDLSTNTVSNYAQNVYGTVDASYVNGASVNYIDLSYVGVGGLKLNSSNTVLSSIPSWATTTQGLNYPTGVDIDSTNTYMYVLNDGNGSISRISISNPSTYIANWFSTSLSGVGGIVIDSTDTYMYVLDSTNIKKIPLSNQSGSNYSVLATLGTPNGALAIDNTNTYLYATNANSNLVYKILISNGTYTTFATSTQGLSYPIGLAIDPSNTYIYVANNTSNSISRILLSSASTYVTNWATSTQGITGPNRLVVDSQNKYLYIANGVSNTVSQISITSPTTIFNATYATTTQGIKSPVGITFDATGTNLYVVNVLGGGNSQGTISKIFYESQYVSLNSNSVVNTTNFISNNGMTFACWFYSSDSSNNAPIFDFGTNTGDDIILSIFNNQILCKILNTGTFYSLSSLATYNKSFRHVVWTMSYSAAATSTWNLYIDASRVNTISTNKYPLQVARNQNYLGKSNYSTDPFFNGYIDDFRVYQRVLTQTEINQLYTYTNTLNVKSGNLSWTAANTTKTPLTYNYFYKDNSLNITSTPVNTTYTNSVINNLIDGNGITYSVNSQVDTKQSKYVSVTK